ncbi:MAG: PspA/IM30 family protein [Oribacterium sp.]|nr:PspA/IM30 family protein [Oribacterium sp.]
MSVLSRFSSIMKSNINALLDSMEDPSKMIDQNLRELRENLAEVKKETAGIMADEKMAARKLQECKDNIANCEKAAKNALVSGNENDARKILEKKANYANSLAGLQTTYDAAHQNAEKMRQMHDKLASDIAALESRKDSIKAKIAVANAQDKVNKMTSGSSKANASIESFDKWEAKANKMLDQANAEAELNAGTDDDNLVSKYASSSSADADAELAKMKAELGL